ncbi:hypothetical protein BDQ17DRAFT_1022929 [Cyathus striatus]|nr:hypothetical protein BDQ17DRAFT_1022929 [Cyathus striatus]
MKYISQGSGRRLSRTLRVRPVRRWRGTKWKVSAFCFPSILSLPIVTFVFSLLPLCFLPSSSPSVPSHSQPSSFPFAWRSPFLSPTLTSSSRKATTSEYDTSDPISTPGTRRSQRIVKTKQHLFYICDCAGRLRMCLERSVSHLSRFRLSLDLWFQFGEWRVGKEGKRERGVGDCTSWKVLALHWEEGAVAVLSRASVLVVGGGRQFEAAVRRWEMVDW